MDNNIKDEDPVFTSTQINDTKSRSSGDYFKNIQKASLWQKLTTSYAKYRNDSIERQKASAEAGKAKRAKRRAEADLKAMSVNIPTAAENGNPALMNTHYAPPPRAKANPLVMAGLGLLAVGLVVGIVLLIVKPWQVEPIELPTYVDDYYDDEEYEEDEGSTSNLDEELGIGEYAEKVEGLLAFDVSSADHLECSNFVQEVIDASGVELPIMQDGKIDGSATAEKIDEIIGAAGITDQDQLVLFEIEKARFFMMADDYNAGLAILDSMNESDMNNCKRGLYYTAFATYYKRIDNEEKSNEYLRKTASLRINTY